MNPFSPFRRQLGAGSRIIAGAVLALLCAVSTACGPGQDQDAGMEALRATRETLVDDAFEEIRNLRLVSETRARTPRGPATLEFTMVVTPDGRFRLERERLDGTTLTVVDDGERMMIRDAEGTRTASAEMRRRITGQLWRNPAYLMANLDSDELEVTDLDTTKVRATTYREIQISPPESSPFSLLLHSQSMRPARVRYTARTVQGPTDATDVFHEFRDVAGGVRLPHRMVTYRGERASSETVYTTIETNVELEEGYFSLDDEPGGEGGPSGGEADPSGRGAGSSARSSAG